jgi:hypothetical protein
MGKRFVRVGGADKRAIDLHRQLRAMEAMPSIEVQFSRDGTKIYLGDKNDQGRGNVYTVDQILMLDVQQAKEAGGTWEALVMSCKRIKREPQVTQHEVDEGLQSFLSGEED